MDAAQRQVAYWRALTHEGDVVVSVPGPETYDVLFIRNSTNPSLIRVVVADREGELLACALVHLSGLTAAALEIEKRVPKGALL